MWEFENFTDRRVTSVSVNDEGYVTRLWNDDGEWSSRSASDAILDLELGTCAYYVRWSDESAAITDDSDEGGRFLYCSHEGVPGNALLLLPRHGAAIASREDRDAAEPITR
jgi:hypothetical protein